MTHRDVSWIVVDLGGVAAQFRPERRLDALERATRIPGDVIQQRLFDSGLDHAAELGHHSVESITDTLLSSLEHRISVPALIDAWSLRSNRTWSCSTRSGAFRRDELCSPTTDRCSTSAWPDR